MTFFWTNILRYFHMAILCVALFGLGQPAAAMAHDMMAPEMSSEVTMENHCDKEETAQDSSENSCCDLGDCDPSCMGMSATLGHALDFSIKDSPQPLNDQFINHMIAVVLTSDLPPPQA